MEHLLSGLACLVHSIQQYINIDLHISNSYIRVIWYSADYSDVIDFDSFEWSSDEEMIRSIQSSINYVTNCAVTGLLKNTDKVAA